MCPSLCLALACFSLLSVPVPAQEGMARLQPHSFQTQVTLDVGYKYLLYLPDGYDAKDTGKAWPLIVFLHGAGERGDDLAKLRVHGPPKLIAAGKSIPAIVASPQAPTEGVWNPHGVKALVDALKREHRVDPARIYLTGISMGGFGTFDTMFEYPDVFAAALPICGGAGVKFVMARAIKDLPMWIFHGEKDLAVPVEFSQKIHAALRKAGGDPKLTIYPGVAHDSWTQTYDNPEVWEWLFAQKRASSSADKTSSTPSAAPESQVSSATRSSG